MKNLLAYFKFEKLLCIVFLICGILITILGILEPKFTANMLTSITKVDLDSTLYFAVIIAIISITEAIVKYNVRKTSVKLRTNISKTLSEDLCKKALNIKTPFLSDFKSGELQEISRSDPSNFLNDFQEFVMLIFNIIRETAITIYVFILSWQCGILFLAFSFITFLIQKNSLWKESENLKNSKKSTDSSKTLISQIYKGISEIKVLDLKKPIFDIYDSILDQEADATKEKEYAKSANRCFSNVAFELYVLAFMFLGIFLMKINFLSLSSFIVIFMYKSQLYSFIFDISEARSLITEMKVLTSRINKLLKIDEYKLENYGKINASQENTHSINIEHLDFSYDGKAKILEDINVTIKSGSFIGIVGESGSAKTTLIKLLSRQLDPASGRITIDGINYNEYSENGFCSLVSLASQEPFIFSFSIRKNLLMVKPNATESELWKALEDARLLEFVKSLPNGIDTVLQENLNISGGQKQRLSLARLFLKDTPIILMDEATSALDNKTQAEITELILKKAKEGNKIFIAIAHRIEAVEKADIIYFFDNGKIENYGCHEELLKDLKYRKLLAKED